MKWRYTVAICVLTVAQWIFPSLIILWWSYVEFVVFSLALIFPSQITEVTNSNYKVCRHIFSFTFGCFPISRKSPFYKGYYYRHMNFNKLILYHNKVIKNNTRNWNASLVEWPDYIRRILHLSVRYHISLRSHDSFISHYYYSRSDW